MGLVELGGVARGELFRCFLRLDISKTPTFKDSELNCTCAIFDEYRQSIHKDRFYEGWLVVNSNFIDIGAIGLIFSACKPPKHHIPKPKGSASQCQQ